MVDTTRFQVSPENAVLVIEAAALLTDKSDDKRVSVLELATYFPFDVERIGRVLESAHDEDPTIVCRDEDGVSYYSFEEPEKYIKEGLDLSDDAYLEANGLSESLRSLVAREQWVRKLRDQHEILRLMASCDESSLDLSYFVSRLDMPSAKIQSLLNDFAAEGYIQSQYDEETDTLTYRVPAFEYPRDHFYRNIEFVSQLDTSSNAKNTWMIIAASALVLLAVILFFVL